MSFFLHRTYFISFLARVSLELPKQVEHSICKTYLKSKKERVKHKIDINRIGKLAHTITRAHAEACTEQILNLTHRGCKTKLQLKENSWLNIFVFFLRFLVLVLVFFSYRTLSLSLTSCVCVRYHFAFVCVKLKSKH